MSVEIQRISPMHNYELFDRAFEWLRLSPTWRQHAEVVFGTLNRDEYLMAAHNEGRVDIGIWGDGQYIAKMTLHLVAKYTYEVSLEAARNANPTVIAEAGCLIRDQLFGLYNAREVIAWIPRWAKGVQHIAATIGFHTDHVTMLRGTCRGRVIEWLKFSLRASNEQ